MEMVFKMEAGGDNKLWIIKPTELSNISYNPMYRRGYIGQHVNFSIQDIQDSSVWSDLDLEFHGCIVQHFGYNGKIDILKKYVETIWGINSKGQLSGTKLSKFDRLYPDLKFLSSLFVSLAYNGEFYYAIKYVNNFQKYMTKWIILNSLIKISGNEYSIGQIYQHHLLKRMH